MCLRNKTKNQANLWSLRISRNQSNQRTNGFSQQMKNTFSVLILTKVIGVALTSITWIWSGTFLLSSWWSSLFVMFLLTTNTQTFLTSFTTKASGVSGKQCCTCTLPFKLQLTQNGSSLLLSLVKLRLLWTWLLSQCFWKSLFLLLIKNFHGMELICTGELRWQHVMLFLLLLLLLIWSWLKWSFWREIGDYAWLLAFCISFSICLELLMKDIQCIHLLTGWTHQLQLLSLLFNLTILLSFTILLLGSCSISDTSKKELVKMWVIKSEKNHRKIFWNEKLFEWK